MGYNFPGAPLNGDNFTPPGGPTWRWNGTAWEMVGPSGANVSGQYVTATGGSVARTLADHFGDILNIKDFGAIGNGVADDSAAIAAAVNASNAMAATGRPPLLRAPAGTYRLVDTPIPTFVKGGGIMGDGPAKTIFNVDTAWPAGDVFSWSDAWGATNSPPEGPSYVSLSNHKVGPIARDFGIVGTTAAGATHNGLCFYDRNDEAIVENIDISYLTGRAIYVGASKNVAGRGYTRESHFTNIRVATCGSVTLPSVEITSVGDNVAGSDATDACEFINLNIFAPKAGGGLVIRNNRTGVGANVGIRTLRFYGLRVEGVYNPVDAVSFTGDLVRIGDPAYSGRIYDIEIHGFTSASSYAGFSAIKIDAPDAATQPFAIKIAGVITSGQGGGINVQRGRNLTFNMLDIGTTGTHVTIGANAGQTVLIDGYGVESVWTYNIATTVADNVLKFPSYKSDMHPGIRDSSIVTSYYTSPAIIPSATAAAVAANLMYSQPFLLPHKFVDIVGIEVTVGAAGAARLGIYTNNNGVPGTLIQDFGTVDTTTLGILELSISTILPRDWFWAVAVFNAAPTCRGGIGSGQYLGNNVINSSARLGLHGALTYATLPANAPAMSNGSVAAPAIFFRKT